MNTSLPERIGPYKVRRLLGEGCSAWIFHAEKDLGRGRVRRGRRCKLRDVAIKVPKPGTSDELFVDEAAIGSRVRHQNLVKASRLFRYKGRPCIEMELVRGVQLDKLVVDRRVVRPMHPLRAAEVVRQAGVGLNHFHGMRSGMGVPLRAVHCDVKTSNIIVTTRGRVKVCDMGVSQFYGGTFQSEPDMVRGTPEFMSPEQATAQVLDGRSDVFALGTLLFTLVMARHPFAGCNATETMNMVALGQYRDQLVSFGLRSPELLHVLARCWFVDRRHRFQSAGELAHELGRVQKMMVVDWNGEEMPPTLVDMVAHYKPSEGRRVYMATQTDEQPVQSWI
ncbi:serine/threonine protein kinase [Candidatus Uhrbacteria bacterium]|nr:serine/threonine protein kinase [Candidatus Uhrbacteria bacterium]